MLTLTPAYEGKKAVPSPEVTNLMLEMLDLKPTDKLLEIGTGSGYQTQRFADTGVQIHTIELEPWVDSTVVIGECVFARSGDGRLGIPEAAPFTAIVVTCGVEQIPDVWVKQLTENGRLLIPIGDSGSQRLTLFKKMGFELIPQRIGAYVRFQMLKEPPKPGKVKYGSHQ